MRRYLLLLAASWLSSSFAQSSDNAIRIKLQQLSDEHHVCAVAVAIVRHGRLEQTHLINGCRLATPLSKENVFEAASLGKPLFAYAVLQLEKQGKIGLDIPLLSYLPEGYVHRQNPFDNAHPAKTDLVTDAQLEKVTARMVLSHTSGLPNWSKIPLHFESAPGQKWSYSGEGYLLLQRAVEAITGMPIDTVIKESLFKRVEMPYTSYAWDVGSGRHLIPSIKPDGTERHLKPFTASIVATTLYSNADDYGRFLAHVLVDKVALDEISSFPVPVSEQLGLFWGLGWGIERNAEGLFIWHWGNNPGYRAFVMASVQTGDGFVMFTNGDDGLQLAEPIAQVILPGEHKLFHFWMLHG